MKISGVVQHGSEVGRTMGFPTANIVAGRELDGVESGVYAAWLWVDGERYAAMAYLGRKPTFGERAADRLLEVNVFDFRGDIYGRRIEVELLDYIREEQKFESREELIGQIAKDKVQIKSLLSLRGK